jgi:beta-glucosidase
MFHDELAHGLLANDATIFPSAPALGSTWDPDLVEQAYAVAAREARVRGTQVALTPVVDIARDPRWGRVDEFFGEDPEHVAQMSVAAVRGLQGRSRPLGADRVFATLKHLVHGTPQGGLNISPADMSERTLREVYLVPFARVVEQADPAIIMPSYNEFQGVPNHANVDVLQRIGRRLLGFKGAYFSDYGGIDNLVSQHHVTASNEDAAVLAMNAGVQVDLPEGVSYRFLPKLVREGRITEAQVNEAVAQVLALKFEAGLFENPYIDLKPLQTRTNIAADIALARKVAQRSLILLKNDGTAPLAGTPRTKLAVIGPSAIESYYGGYAGANSRSVTILDGLRRNAPPGMTIEHSDGVWITSPDPTGPRKSYSPMEPIDEADDQRRISAAVELARRSDVVLSCSATCLP